MAAWMLMYFQKNNIHKIAIISSSDGMGSAASSLYAQYISKYTDFNVQVVLQQTYVPDAVTFGSLVSALTAHPEVQAVITGGATMATALAIGAIRDAGITVPVLGDAAITSPDIMAVQKAKDALTANPGFIAPNNLLGMITELPDSYPVKAWLQQVVDFYKKQMNVDANTLIYMISYNDITITQNVMTRLLSNDSGIFEKDLATTRSAIRDNFETTKDLVAGGIITMSPTNHMGIEWGTSLRLGQIGPDGTEHYLTQYSTSPPERY